MHLTVELTRTYEQYKSHYLSFFKLIKSHVLNILQMSWILYIWQIWFQRPDYETTVCNQIKLQVKSSRHNKINGGNVNKLASQLRRELNIQNHQSTSTPLLTYPSVYNMCTRKKLKSATASDSRKGICQYDRKGRLGYDLHGLIKIIALFLWFSHLVLDK